MSTSSTSSSSEEEFQEYNAAVFFSWHVASNGSFSFQFQTIVVNHPKTTRTTTPTTKIIHHHKTIRRRTNSRSGFAGVYNAVAGDGGGDNGGDIIDPSSGLADSSASTVVDSTPPATSADSCFDESLVDIGIEPEKIASYKQHSEAEVDDNQHDDNHSYNSTEQHQQQPYFASPSKTLASLQQQKERITQKRKERKQYLLSRRSAFEYGGILFTGSLLTGAALQQNRNSIQETTKKSTRPSLLPEPVLKKSNQQSPPPKSVPPPSSKNGPAKPSPSPTTTTAKPTSTTTTTTSTTTTKKIISPEVGRLEPVNLTQVALETNINVTLDCKAGCISVDSKNFTKIQRPKLPSWYPSFLAPPSPKIVKDFSNSELLVAATIAGATTEMGRTALLYPLQTIKTRVQVQQHNFTRRPPPLSEQFVTLVSNVKEKFLGRESICWY